VGKNNPEHKREYDKAYRAKNLERISEKYKWRHLRRTYGLTREDYEAMIAAQAGKCSICGEPMNRMAVDHDHATGRVRALLCIPCNAALGHVENAVWLASAKNYLEAHKC
jgi:hypothetical protein